MKTEMIYSIIQKVVITILMNEKYTYEKAKTALNYNYETIVSIVEKEVNKNA
jgi:hypothetical protein